MRFTYCVLKGYITPKTWTLSSFTTHHTVPNPYDFHYSLKHRKEMLGRKTAPCDVRQWRLKLSFRYILTNVPRKEKSFETKLIVWWQFRVNYPFRSCEGPKYTSLTTQSFTSNTILEVRNLLTVRLYHCEMHTSNTNSPSSAQYGKCIKLMCHSNIIYRCLHDKTKLAFWLSHMMKASLICPAHFHGRLNSQQKPATISNVKKQPMCFNDLNNLYIEVTLRLIKQMDGAVCQAGLSITNAG